MNPIAEATITSTAAAREMVATRLLLMHAVWQRATAIVPFGPLGIG